MSGDEFLAALDELQKEAVAAAIPHVVPMRTKDDALAAHAKKKEHYEHAIEALDPSSPVIIVNAEPETPPPPPPLRNGSVVPTAGRRGTITEEDKADIRRRYKQAKAGKPRIERGWVKHVAKEYNISESYIYNIVYTDPSYQAIP